MLAPALVVAVWWAFASPKAPYGGPVVRPVVKVLVFGLASWGLWLAGQHGLGSWRCSCSLSSSTALAQVPSIRALATETADPKPAG